MAIRQRRLFPLKEITNMSRQFDPSDVATSGAQAFQAAQGQRFSTTGLGDVQRSGEHGHATYLAYRQGMQAPTEQPGLRESYESMREHVNRQYEHLTTPVEKGGMGVTHEVTAHDPYESAAGMGEDLQRNRRIQTFASASTGPHEFFSPGENDKFRAVHDVFGHAAVGRGFSRHGEEAAFLAHRQMFPKEAHAALASETRGQNAYLNYSGTGQFPSQGGRLVGLPSWASSKSRTLRPGRSKIRKGGEGQQLSLF